MIFSKPSTFALGLCLAAVSLSASAGPTNVPFSAAITTQEYVVPSVGGSCGGLPSGISVGAGTATHLGAVSVVATDCILPVGAPPVYSQYFFSNGKLIFKSSSGDALFAQYQGGFVQQSGKLYVINGGTFQITGGTGRFQNATGGGELRGTETISLDPLQPSQGQLQAVGTISY